MRAPSPASARTAASPMPEVAPVASLPCSRGHATQKRTLDQMKFGSRNGAPVVRRVRSLEAADAVVRSAQQRKSVLIVTCSITSPLSSVTTTLGASKRPVAAIVSARSSALARNPVASIAPAIVGLKPVRFGPTGRRV